MCGDGKNATLILNKIPDERWRELHQPQHCYGKHLTILQQRQFCSWEDTLSELLGPQPNQEEI